MTSSERMYFGTDGARGLANVFLTPELALMMAKAAGAVFMRHNGNHRHRVIIGKDTRESGYMLEYAMVAGFTSVGVDVLLTGPLPTPAIAMLTRTTGCDMGVMITASHNRYMDNGIKLFGANGYKLPDETESEIEAVMADDPDKYRAKSGKLGRAKRIDGVNDRYIQYVKGTLRSGADFEGMKIVLDSANGAAHQVGPVLLDELGADVVAMGNEPNGTNINDKCGSTYPRMVAARVLMEEAHMGIALDGDADRVIIIDEKGQEIDGDQLLACIGKSLQGQGLLKGGIVATVMSNLGFERYVNDVLQVPLVRTQVGDRYVNEKMQELGYNLGGEQSGHIVLSDYSTTGDGLIAGLQILSEVRRAKRPASEVLHLFNPVPQVLKNVRFKGANPLDDDRVKSMIAKAEASLQGKGRLLVRKSGTEPVVRIMAEGDDRIAMEELASSLAKAVEAA